MHPVQKHLMDTNFADLAGTQIEGTVAISDELVNLGLMEALAKLKAAAGPATTEAAATAEATKVAAPDVDPKALLAQLNIERLQYRTEQGKTMLDVKLNFG